MGVMEWNPLSLYIRKAEEMAARQEPKNIVQTSQETPDFTNMNELQAYIGPLQQQLERAMEFRNSITERHKEELVQIDEQIAKIGDVLRALGEKVPANVPKAKPKATQPNPNKGKKMPSLIMVRRASGTPTGFGISLESAAQQADKIKEMVANGQETFTQKQAYKALDWDQSKGSAAFRFMEACGFIKSVGHNDSRAITYAINDPDAMEKKFEESDRITQEFVDRHTSSKISVERDS